MYSTPSYADSSSRAVKYVTSAAPRQLCAYFARIAVLESDLTICLSLNSSLSSFILPVQKIGSVSKSFTAVSLERNSGM